MQISLSGQVGDLCDRIGSISEEMDRRFAETERQSDEMQRQSDEMQRQSDEVQRQIDEMQRQIDRLRVDLYFAQLSSGRIFSPTKAVELKVPNTAIEMILCGPAEDRSIIQAIVFQNGYYESHLVTALARWIPDTAVCIDIGANLGAISLQLSKIASKGHIYSFEPASVSFEYLTQNIAANSIDNVTAYKLGISDKTHDLVLNYISDLSGCSFVMGSAYVPPPSEISTAKPETIHCVSIDEWMSKSNIPPIDFIKLDAEGMELAALHGADTLLRRDQPDLAVEFNPHTNNDFGHGSSLDLYEKLKTYWDQIYLLPKDVSEPPILIHDFGHLMLLVDAGSGWEDLFCTTKKRQRSRAHESSN